jgi:predicted translin family RNA/ssDNA-binding protein
MWLDKLKIAIIEKNADALNELMEDLPQLKDKKEIEEALYLLKEATSLMHTLKNETSASMKQIKKNLDFLRSTDVPTSKKLDIMS